MSLFTRLRRLFARRAWIVWAVAATVAVIVAASVYGAVASVDDERAAWGDETTVWMATDRITAGEPVGDRVERRTIPRAMSPADAVDADDQLDSQESVARQDIGTGSIVTTFDVAGHDADSDLVPPGWVVVAVREPIPSGATVAARASVSADGTVLASEAIVVGTHEDTVQVAVPAPDGPAVAAAATSSRATLLLSP